MNNLNQTTNNFEFSRGLPPMSFLETAWASEPLTGVLKDTNIPFALPAPDPKISVVVKDHDRVIGQGSSTSICKYWDHIAKIDTTEQNLSTQIFVKIQKLAVQAEKECLEKLGESPEKAYRNAGTAVLPKYRGKKVGAAMAVEQMKICHEIGAKVLFCETTNRYSAVIAKSFGFSKVVEYPYSVLASKLDHPSLSEIEDSFTIWVLKV